jgi:AraC family transcriptional regulator, regulatory protein of adaptative response / DNA-3-methyladenine glycosylase II
LFDFKARLLYWVWLSSVNAAACRSDDNKIVKHCYVRKRLAESYSSGKLLGMTNAQLSQQPPIDLLSSPLISMQLNPEACYSAMMARDRRFDGQFFVGVTSTGIYCRPVCKVRIPKSSNCLFFGHSALAEARGFRPCMKCRPELAPGHLAHRQKSALAQAARDLIESGTGLTIQAIADRLGVTERHLRRLFHEEFLVSPIEYDQTQRLLFAKRLLSDTAWPMQQVAQASGFASVRRFNALFLQRYRMAPTRLRLHVKSEAGVKGSNMVESPKKANQFDHSLSLRLSYREPFDWPWLMRFLQLRSIAGVEQVVNNIYARTFENGWLAARHDVKARLVIVDVSTQSIHAIRGLIIQLRRLFDLDCEPQTIESYLGALALAKPGVRLPGAFDGFELAVRAVLGQQVTVKAATTLAGRFAKKFGTAMVIPDSELLCGSIKQAVDGLGTVFPKSSVIANATVDDIASLGIVSKRSQALITLAQALESGQLKLAQGASSQQSAELLIEQLCALPGFGPWTAHYIAMRVLGWPDAFPAADIGVMKAMGAKNAKQAQEQSQQWSPWRAYAVMHLWASLEGEEK